MSEITTLISSVGFPVVMCLLFYYQGIKNDEKMQELLNEIKSIVSEIKGIVKNGG